MSDIEISRNCKMLNIKEIASKLSITDNVICYGDYKAKIDFKSVKGDKKGKLILVTSINPTPYGEGKTTVSIGLNDALCRLNESSVAVLREPSLGPVFGIKGGATGGGYAQVVPMEDINLHFTGDMHAITSCNNLLASAIDNHIYFGNELGIKKVVFPRCLDINDRILRNVKLQNRDDYFVITAASEIMAILCLCEDLESLKHRLSNIIIGYNKDDKPVLVKDLGCTDALTILLKDAIKPNLVQSLEGNPIIIHGGPFANIAHGCNSLIATKLGLKLASYVITEAGFGSDLGAEKFMDIKCLNGIKPSVIVLNVTIKALKYHSDNSIDLKQGISNLEVHILNMKKYLDNIIVCINKFDSDTDSEIDFVKDYCSKLDVEVEVFTSYKDGGKGGINLANKVISMCKNDVPFNRLYDIELDIKSKIEKVSKEIYHSSVEYLPSVIDKIKKIEQLGYKDLPICIAKTQYSITDNKNLKGFPKNSTVTVRDIEVKGGANFIVVYMGDIISMPGLSKNPNLLNMTIDKDSKIDGLF